MTNQNDTQDEAEPTLMEKLEELESRDPGCRPYAGQCSWDAVYAKGYRAGAASKAPEIADLNVSMDECFAKTREMIREASKAKTRDSFFKANIELSKELAAEKAKTQKLVEALKYYRGIVKGTWGYDGIIAAKYDNAISDYSTDSGDGEKG